MSLVALALACSDYAFQKEGDVQARPALHDSEPALDSDPPEDSEEPGREQIYCTPFDDFEDWNQSGEGAWRVEEGLLTEGRYGEYEAIAWLHDLGAAERFGVRVDVAWTGNANDLSGVVWGYEAGSGLAVRWDDPQGYYERYDPVGRMDLSVCEGSSCTALVTDSSADLYHPADKTFATLEAVVDGDALHVFVDDVLVMQSQVPQLSGSGPGVVGLFSDDNDGGVWFDNFCVWTEG